MWNPGTEIENAVKLLMIDCSVLDNNSSEKLFTKVLSGLTREKVYQYPLWEYIFPQKSEYNPDGWKNMKEYIKGKETVLFVEWNENRKMYVFKDGEVIISILANSSFFVFYVTNMNADFILSQNDHDYFIAGGDAVNWQTNI